MAQTGSLSVEVDGRRLQVSNLDKVMYPATETTKGEVLHYYATIATVLLPHLAGPAGDPDPLAARHHRPVLLREEPALRRPGLAAVGDGALQRVTGRGQQPRHHHLPVRGRHARR